MSHSTNWKANAIPSITGNKIMLEVSGSVPSGIISPKLVAYSPKAKQLSNVVTLLLENEAPGSTTVVVRFSQDITGKDKLDTVLIFNEADVVIAKININRKIYS